MSKRKNSITNHKQHGNWLKRFRYDGVLPFGKKKTSKIKTVIQPQRVNRTIPPEEIKNFCNHSDIQRLSNALTKVQIEGIKMLVAEAKKGLKKAIIISFMPSDAVRKYLEEQSFFVKRLSLRKRGPKKPVRQKVLIGW